MATSLTGFAIAAAFSEDHVVLAVAGDMDVLTAPELSAIIESMVGRGHPSIVLDLADVGFRDASGLVSSSRQCAPSDGQTGSSRSRPPR